MNQKLLMIQKRMIYNRNNVRFSYKNHNLRQFYKSHDLKSTQKSGKVKKRYIEDMIFKENISKRKKDHHVHYVMNMRALQICLNCQHPAQTLVQSSKQKLELDTKLTKVSTNTLLIP